MGRVLEGTSLLAALGSSIGCRARADRFYDSDWAWYFDRRQWLIFIHQYYRVDEERMAGATGLWVADGGIRRARVVDFNRANAR